MSRTPNRHTPKITKPTNEEERARKTHYQILMDSEINREVWRVIEAAEALDDMIEQFQNAHNRDMTDVRVAEMGVTPNPSLSEWALDHSQDIIGFRWVLNLFRGLLHPLGRTRNALNAHDATEADEPTVVASR